MQNGIHREIFYRWYTYEQSIRSLLSRDKHVSGPGGFGPVGFIRSVFYLYLLDHPIRMNPDEDFAAWSPEFEARLKACTDVADDIPTLTDVRQEAQLSDYSPVTFSKGKYEINWLGLRRYCKDVGCVCRVRKDGEFILYRFSMKTGYYYELPLKILVNELIRGILDVAPNIPLSTRFPSMVEVNILPNLPDIDNLATTESRRELTKPYFEGEVIPFKNGVYSILHNKLLPRTSYVFIEHPLDVNFNPSALSNGIRERYLEMMCGDEKLFELLFEQMGYIMYAKTFNVPTCTILYGAGANGKSVVLDILSKLIGNENFSTLSMYDMANSFSIAQSEGKLVNISSDSSAGPGSAMMATSDVREFIKKSTSGEMYTFNPKNKSVHMGYGPRKFIFASNVLLNFGGMDGGLARRMYAIPFNATFKEDRNIKCTFYEPDAMEWFAMQALVSLMCMLRRRMHGKELTETDLDGEYLICEASQEMKSEQMAAQDTMLDWLSTDLELDIQNKEEVRQALIDRAELYLTYSRFCRDTGRQPKSMKLFHASLKTQFGIGQRRSTRDGTHIYIATEG